MANDEQNDLCHSPVYQPKFSGPEQKDDQTHIQADHVSLSKDNVSIFTGNVDIRRNDQFITADRVEYQQNENFLQAQGKVQFNTPQIKIEASKAEFHIDDNQSNLENILFTTTQRAHGGADSIRVISENLAIMKNTRATPMMLCSVLKGYPFSIYHICDFQLVKNGYPDFYFPILAVLNNMVVNC
jgi:lipopolysaccharide assembly outer membrane protein LptD (OstA)